MHKSLLLLTIYFTILSGLAQDSIPIQPDLESYYDEIEQLFDLPAFPGAWGAGMYATGGRGGEILLVTNLNDAGPGSLRSAVEASGPRIIIFKVGGTIKLESDLVIENPDITIAGQTAPGKGIALRGAKLNISGDNTIVRYLRVRRGDENLTFDDGIAVSDAENVIVDHCTISWTTDEAINTWHGAKNVTFQWCIVAEALNNSVHEKGEHGYGASLGGENTSYHHNLLAHHTARNPSIAGNADERTHNLDWRNNLVYNWEYRTLDGKPDEINVINNYYKPGPVTQLMERLVRIDDRSGYGLPAGRWYVSGNVLETRKSNDNWKDLVKAEGDMNPNEYKLEEPIEVAPVWTQPAKEIVAPILRFAGVTVPGRDTWEHRIVEEVRTGTAYFGENGIIDSQKDVGGWPELKTAEPVSDGDSDGIPDWWEELYGLNPEDPSDAGQDMNQSGYTNIEEYLNGTNPKIEIDYTIPVNNKNPLHKFPNLLLPH
ncbi:pectate lyase family protein [Autumnicola musiva]|uniref:Pectate lyase n=1 Tax=Autumnicola musiva TaxID=3075589 RepID=A0ABU3D7T7_9FLAO|nr:pectate lyase [Zunongwangia sp. F117]MDT0677582.1 pectate lyase [Zunongwangia sp. F117]